MSFTILLCSGPRLTMSITPLVPKKHNLFNCNCLYLAFDQDEVTAYTMILDFSPLGHNTASFTAHLQGKSQPDQELGIAFISLPAKVLPTVVMKGNTQKLRMEYVSGPWKGMYHIWSVKISVNFCHH